MVDQTADTAATRWSEAEAKAKYKAARKAFAACVVRAETVSRGAANVESETNQHFWASVLFTRLVVTAKTIQMLSPELHLDAHWDFSAVASITRNLAECYLFFYFLCIDNVSLDEKNARIILLNLHDNASRKKLFDETRVQEDDAETVALKAAVHDNLVRKFNANAYLSSLPKKQKRELIKGEKTPFIQDKVIERTTIDKGNFRFLYRFFSQHTHSGPVAFYRMAEHGRGRGFQSHLDTVYMVLALEFARDLIERATVEMLSLFPNAETRGGAFMRIISTVKAASKKKTDRRKGR